MKKFQENWKWYKWGDLILNYQQGAIRSNNELGFGNVNYLKMGDLDGKGSYDYSDLAKTNATDDEIITFGLRKGDFLINVRNSREIVGKSCVIDIIPDNTLFNHMLVRIAHMDWISSVYINAWLNTEYVKKALDGIKSGTTTVIALYQADLYRLPVLIPSKQHIDSVSSLLSTIDKKIRLNNQINDNLEQLTKTLYDYWFVQFEFPDKDGKPYKSSGGKMVWNKKLKREIPVGWEVKSLNDITVNYRGVSYNKEDLLSYPNEGVLVLRGNNIQENRLVYDNNVAYIPSSFVSEEQIIKKHDIIMTMSSGSKEHIGKCVMFQFDSLHTYGAFLTKFTPNNECPYFVFQIMNSEYFKSKIKNICGGTGINNLTNQTFDEILFAYPSNEILSSFEKRLNSFFEKIGINDFEVIRLTQMRDWLLPMLMNGQVHVKNTQQIKSK